MGREIFEGHEVFKSIPYDETPMPMIKRERTTYRRHCI